jgi:hypothetical protein
MSAERGFTPVAPGWWVANAGGVALTGVLAARTGHRGLRRLFWGAMATHAVEAAYAYRAARRAGLERHAVAWALQTLAVGFPSLAALRETRAGLPPAQ